MLLVLGTVQLGVWWHARMTLSAAASTAADILSVERTSTETAREAALNVADSGGVDDVSVTATRGAQQVSVVVRGTAPVVLDLGLADIEVTASAPREVAR